MKAVGNELFPFIIMLKVGHELEIADLENLNDDELHATTAQSAMDSAEKSKSSGLYCLLTLESSDSFSCRQLL